MLTQSQRHGLNDKVVERDFLLADGVDFLAQGPHLIHHDLHGEVEVRSSKLALTQAPRNGFSHLRKRQIRISLRRSNHARSCCRRTLPEVLYIPLNHAPPRATALDELQIYAQFFGHAASQRRSLDATVITGRSLFNKGCRCRRSRTPGSRLRLFTMCLLRRCRSRSSSGVFFFGFRQNGFPVLSLFTDDGNNTVNRYRPLFDGNVQKHSVCRAVHLHGSLIGLYLR